MHAKRFFLLTSSSVAGAHSVWERVGGGSQDSWLENECVRLRHEYGVAKR